jgi:hypothetical protein
MCELVTQHPEHFVDDFAELLPSVFIHLFAASPTTQMLAAQALGALAHASLVKRTSKHFDETLDSSLSAGFERLTKELRTSLAPDDTRAPWAVCTMAYILTLSKGSLRAVRLAINVLNLARGHKKVGVRQLGGLAWRCLMRQLLLKPPGSSADSSWNVIDELVDSGIALGRIAILTNDPQSDPLDALQVVRKMISKGGAIYNDGVELLLRLIRPDSDEESDTRWCLSKLTPLALFDGTLLTCPYTSIGASIKSLVKDQSCVTELDVRALGKEVVCEHWAMIYTIWKEAAIKAEIGADGELPLPLIQVWRSLLLCRVEGAYLTSFT